MYGLYNVVLYITKARSGGVRSSGISCTLAGCHPQYWSVVLWKCEGFCYRQWWKCKVLKEVAIGSTIVFPDRSLVLSDLQLFPLGPGHWECEPGTWVIRNQFLSMSTSVSSSWTSLSAMSWTIMSFFLYLVWQPAFEMVYCDDRWIMRWQWPTGNVAFAKIVRALEWSLSNCEFYPVVTGHYRASSIVNSLLCDVIRLMADDVNVDCFANVM